MALNGTSYQVDGAREFLRTLRKAGVDLEDLKAVNLDAAEMVANKGADMAPRRSGALAATIRASGTKRAGVIRGGNNRKRAGVPYANPIHWGWLSRGIRPNAFLSRAAQQTESRWFPLYERFANEVLNTVKGK